LNTGCALWRRDREEPVENGPRERTAEPVLKPSEALKPKSLDIASPITDRFYMRGSYFQGNIATLMRIDSTGAALPDGTTLLGEEDLGLDDVVNQARMEFNFRMAPRSNVRIDYFKLNRFGQVLLPEDIEFGDFSFDAGDPFRSKLDWRSLSLTYTFSILRTERLEFGAGLGAYVFEMHAEGGEPGTVNRDEDSEAGIFPAGALNFAWRISKRWAFTARHNQLKLVGVDDADGKYQDSHADIQWRWRKNFAVGLGYSRTYINLDVHDADEPFLFDLEAAGPEIFFRASF
jgi:hypothetical protein